MKNLKLVKHRKSNQNKPQSNSCKTLKNTNSIASHVTLVFYSRTPTTNIVKRNNAKLIGRSSESLKKMNDNRLNYPKSKKMSLKYNSGRIQNNGWFSIYIDNGNRGMERTDQSKDIVIGRIVVKILQMGIS